jgi:hypothetical protein
VTIPSPGNHTGVGGICCDTPTICRITGRIALDFVGKGFDTLINHNDTAVKIIVHP